MSARLRTAPPATSALDAQAVHWLLESAEAGVRLQARRDLLGETAEDDARRVLDGPKVKALLAGQQPDGGFGNHPYSKWTGAHWRMVSLVELGLPAGESRARAAYETVLGWLLGAGHRRNVPVIAGRARRCASQEGNALAVGVRLGMAADPRVAQLAESLVEWQWPDGGWNCDKRPAATHSSFNETVAPLWALAEYARATGDRPAAQAAARTCALLLDHGVFKSHRTGKVANPEWLRLRHPAYWHYGLLAGLTMLARAGALPDARADDALARLRGMQEPDGLWHYASPPYWSLTRRSLVEVVDWGRAGPSEMLTLNALRILRAGGG